MKSVLISIQPKWVEKIANGLKTIEVRKTRPNIATPFKCYIYCTNDRKVFLDSDCNNKFWTEKNYGGDHYYNGKVIGEFVCDNIEKVNAKCSDYGIDLFYHDCIAKGCLTEREVEKYFNIPQNKDLRAMKGNGYAWSISELEIYDKPKDLGYCKIMSENNMWSFCKRVENAPQSWMYVDKVGE